MMIETNSPEETYAFGKKLGMEAQAGQVYCLNGDLGVGKTVFTQGFAAGLGIQEPVNSPTFTIVQEYDDGRLPLYHFDVYRLGDVDEMDEIGYEDYFYGEGICLIEWSERIREAGYRIVYDPRTTVFHKESATTGRQSPLRSYYLTRNRLLFARRNRRGTERRLSILYQLGVALPKSVAAALLCGRRDLAAAVLRGGRDFLRHRTGKE